MAQILALERLFLDVRRAPRLGEEAAVLRAVGALMPQRTYGDIRRCFDDAHFLRLRSGARVLFRLEAVCLFVFWRANRLSFRADAQLRQSFVGGCRTTNASANRHSDRKRQSTKSTIITTTAATTFFVRCRCLARLATQR